VVAVTASAASTATTAASTTTTAATVVDTAIVVIAVVVVAMLPAATLGLFSLRADLVVLTTIPAGAAIAPVIVGVAT
jgi:hypothetical protein